MPDTVAEQAKASQCRSIACTYSEPTIFFEYASDIGAEAHKRGLLNLFVTNGYMTLEALDVLAPNLDAANVDLKGFDDRTYRRVMGAKLGPVLEFIKGLKKIESIRVFALGVKPEHRKIGVGAVFYIDTLLVAKKRGYKWGEMSWILESNDKMNRAIQAMGGAVYKTYRIFQKDI